MQFCLKKILSICVLMALPILSHASLVTFTEADCPLLANPKTVLLVHATWCPHCRSYKPVYEKVSNLDKYKEWTFFEIAADDLSTVCGTWVDGYPYTYKNNMRQLLKGNWPQREIERFLDWG